MNINISGECYICSLENAPLSPCKCKNMFIHEKCQIKSIRRLKNLNCTVCKGEYTNIKVRTIKRTRFTRISKIIIEHKPFMQCHSINTRQIIRGSECVTEYLC